MICVSTRKQGFTLVEMIVVIAIIAILAAVIIPTTAGFIDRARLSNDRQAAASMTRALQGAIILEEHTEYLQPDGALSLIGVHTLINTFSDEAVTFENAAKNTGFFYIPDGVNSRIEAWKYNEAPTGQVLHHDFEPTRFLNLQRTSANQNDCFWLDLCGNGGPILISTTSNDPVVIVVFMIYNGVSAENINRQIAHYEGPLKGILGRNVAIINSMKTMYEGTEAPFNENNRIFITNSGWQTHRTFVAEGDNTIQRIVFAPDIVHIPDLEGLGGFELAQETLVLPRTVRSIAQNAFKDITGLEKVELYSGHPLRIFGDGLSKDVGQPLSGNIGPLSAYSQHDLVNYSDSMSTHVTQQDFTIDFSELPIRGDVVGYNIVTRGVDIEIVVFTRNLGLMGIIKNEYIVTYHYNFEGAPSDVFNVARHHQNTFVYSSVLLIRPTHTFTGWCLDPACDVPIAAGDPLPSKVVSVYAKWEE